MLGILSDPTYARLFAAHVVALLGTGLMTVALALLAFDMAGERAGAVLGTALAIKMIAYVGLAPITAALAERLPRKAVLVGADLIRAAVALALPFVDAVWQIYALIFLLQAASAAFTPAFQALIPEVLPDEADYTRALSLSRLAYDLENLASPALAGLLLLAISHDGLFAGTALGFLASAALVASTVLPSRAPDPAPRGFLDRVTGGARIYLATPRLRGLLALSLAAAAGGAFVIVNTVVIVRGAYAGSQTGVAVALAAFGAGSMLAALALPRLLERLPDRAVMVSAAALLAALTLAGGLVFALAGPPPRTAFLLALAIAGALYSAVLTPSGRLLRVSAHAPDRPALFAAHFALSHACWLVTYPLAGWLGDAFGLSAALLVLGALAALAVAAAARLWPAAEPDEIAHAHPDLPPDHPHLRRHGANGHRHAVVIDDAHRIWPSQG